MKFGHLEGTNIESFLRKAEEAIWHLDWMIVALDSSRGEDLIETAESLVKSSYIAGASIIDKHGWRLNGKVLRAHIDILVPFCAVYLLNEDCIDFRNLYDLTSESDQFDQDIPLELKEAFRHAGVLAYFADGCGLNYCMTDEIYSSFTRSIAKD